MSTLTLSLLQTHTHWHDPVANRALFESLLDQVPDGAHVAVLPEMFSTGFTMSSSEVAEPQDGDTARWLRDQAQARDVTLTGSVVIGENGRYFNRLLWTEPNGRQQRYDKRHLFRMAGEHEHYAAGEQRLVVTCEDFRICASVCYDLRFPVWLRNRNDYDVLLVVANWPAARLSAWHALLRARAIENQAYVVAVNILGVDGNGVEYAGGTCAYGPEGETLLDAQDQAGVHTLDLDLPALRAYRADFPAWQDADTFELD